MINPYKRMYVLAEEEYNRLKLLQNSKLATDDALAAAATTSKTTSAIANRVVVVEEPSSKLLLTHVDDDEPQLPPLPATQPKQFSCIICGKTYKHKRDLRRHVQLVHGVYPPTKVIIPKSAIQDKNNNNNIVTNETEIGRAHV